jgi:hypothetical protein
MFHSWSNSCFLHSQNRLGNPAGAAIKLIAKSSSSWYFIGSQVSPRPQTEELSMKLDIKNVFASLLVLALVLYPIAAYAALPIRHGSDVGATSNADAWNLFGPTDAVALSTATTVSQEILCPGQQVAAANGDETNAGGCTGGEYLFLFQIRTTKTTPIVISVKNLVGFTFVDDPDGSKSHVGVIECDSGNTVALCTTLGSGSASQFPAVTFTHSPDNTVVNIHIPANLPAYPAGTGTQGQGLTVFVQTQPQSPAVPIGFPKLTGG